MPAMTDGQRNVEAPLSAPIGVDEAAGAALSLADAGVGAAAVVTARARLQTPLPPCTSNRCGMPSPTQ